MGEQRRRPYETTNGGVSMSHKDPYLDNQRLRLQLAALVGTVDAIRWAHEATGTVSEGLLDRLYHEADEGRKLYDGKLVQA